MSFNNVGGNICQALPAAAAAATAPGGIVGVGAVVVVAVAVVGEMAAVVIAPRLHP
jgi:hypothetical protein